MASKLPLLAAVSLALAAIPACAQTSLLITPDASVLPLDDIGLYSVGYQYRDRQKTPFPPGWSGDFDAVTGIALKPAGEQNGRKAFLIHPPWKGGTGFTYQQFQVQLPPKGKVQKVLLRGATTMGIGAVAPPGEPPKSDGVTFRLIANGRTLLNEHRADSNWKPFELDLSEYAGRTLDLRFESDCGPAGNSSFDFALWGSRQLILQGFSPQPVVHPTPPPLNITRLYPTQSKSAVPPSGYDGQVKVQSGADGGTLTYSGLDGQLQYQWMRPRTASDPPLGTWKLRATARGAKSAEIVPLASDAQLTWVSAATFQGSRLVKSPTGLGCVSTYLVNGKTVTLRCTAKLSGKSLVLDVHCDSPQLASFTAGRWGPILRRRAVTAPYYSGQVFYLAKENLFVNAFLDWTASSASYQDGTTAVYRERTDGTHVPLQERVIFSAAWHALETMPNVPNPPSPYRQLLGKKIVLDIWGQRYDEIAAKLQTLHDNGITNCAIIVHVWQRSGYDNALPAHVPADEKLGGGIAMKNLVATAKKLAYLISLHENYADYYPNYEGFNPDDIALRPNGERETAWYNEGTKIQSFAVAPHAMVKLAKEQSTQIKDLYGPNADYLDVHSATPPWFHQDYRAGTKDAGMFRAPYEATKALWAFERQNYHGPVLGEGNNHWYWSGLLDGVEAQFGSGWTDGQTAPLAVDFDLLKIHPLQFNHGMGYYERWWKNPTWGAAPPMEVMDQYRMQEVIYGHAGFLNTVSYSNLSMAWLEHHLLSPVTALYATAKPVDIKYQVNGRWGDSSRAAKAGKWTRTLVEYDNGLMVIANDEASPLKMAAFTLPQYGWIATQGGGRNVAYTALKQGIIVDYARTPNSTFANARRAADWSQSGIHQIQPSVTKFQQTGTREFSLTYGWKIGEKVMDGARSFVHFIDSKDSIVFQNDHDFAASPSTWKSGQSVTDGPYTIRVPENLPDGEYGIRIGLLDKSGARMPLQGRDDGGVRIRLGTLQVSDGGQSIAFKAESAAPDANAIYQRRLNTTGKVIDFGDVRTNGSVLIRREKGEWVLRALPRAGNFTLELSAARFGRPAIVRCLGGSSAGIRPTVKGNWWSLKLNGAGEYHWR